MTIVGGQVPLSVVMPVYNEQDAIVAAVEEVQRLRPRSCARS